MIDFVKYITNLNNELKTNEYHRVAVNPPLDLELPEVYERDWGIDFEFLSGRFSYGVTRSTVCFVADRGVFRELGLLLLVCAVNYTQNFMLNSQEPPVRENGFWIKIIDGDMPLLIHQKCGLPLECHDFPVTGLYYVYAWDDYAYDRRMGAKVNSTHRPSFGYYDREKEITLDFANTPSWVNRTIYIGAGATALLRLGGALLDFSHPESEAEAIEFERHFDQVGDYSYDAHFYIAGTDLALSVFGYDTTSLCKGVHSASCTPT